MQTGTLIRPISTSLLRSYERHLRAENKRPATITHYLLTARTFLSFCEEEHLPEITQVSREHVELWLEALHTTMKPHSVRSYYLSVHQFFNWLRDEDEIERHPMERMKLPAVDEAPKDVVSEEDMARVLAKLEREKRWRDCALVAILYDTGMRASELANCRTVEVNLDTGIIFIPNTKARRVRTAHLSPKAVRYIDRYHRKPRPDTEWLVNGERGQLSRNGIYRIVRKCFAESGVAGMIGAHDLRHTSASHTVGQLSESEMMTLYGWTDPSMARHYASQALQKTAIEAHRRNSPLERLPKAKR